MIHNNARLWTTTVVCLFWACICSPPVHAFAPLQQATRCGTTTNQGRLLRQQQQLLSSSSKRFCPTAKTTTSTSTTTTRLYNQSDEENENEIVRLKQMAAQLRAEAAQLEAQQKQQMATVVEKVFRKFDLNQDGEISLDELKQGLEKAFQTELSEKRVQQLMEDFDKTDSSVLTLETFVSLDVFRNRLDALVREEKAQARAAAESAKREQEAYKLIQKTMESINDRPPSYGDKIVSILPYLLPLLDSIEFARFLVLGNPTNPLAMVIGVLYALYRVIPFGGLIAFFALGFLSGNLSINRLIRYNMQQAIFLDIALIFPGLIAGITQIVGVRTPPGVAELASDAAFFTTLAVLGYCVVSSLLGVTPNKIPIISEAVEARIPSIQGFEINGKLYQPDELKKKKEEDKIVEDKDKVNKE